MEGLQGNAVAGDGVLDGAVFGEVGEGKAQLSVGKLNEIMRCRVRNCTLNIGRRVPPHPGPLPGGEGESHSVAG